MKAIRNSVLALCAFGLMLSGVAAVKKPSLEPRWSGANQAEWTMDRAAALANAKADGRWTLVLLTGAWWCPWCQPVEEKVFKTEAWNDYAVANGYYEVQTDYPGRDGKSRPCWLWDKGFQEKNGLTPEEAASNVVERLKYQADIVKKLPGTYPCEAMGSYHADNTVVQIDWSDFDHPQTNRWEAYAPVPYSDYKSDVGYGTVFVYAPTGELVGRFPSAVRDGYDENKDALPGKVWTEAEAFAQITNRIEKAKGGKSYVRVSVDSECEKMGSVTKVDKLFAKGATVTLKATAKSGYVFTGWYAYGIPLTDFSFDYRTASASFKADGKDRIITALFAAKSDDKYITISCEPEDGYSVTNAMSLPVSVSSRSLPTVTAKPLPAGLKLVAPSAANGWCATITGTPTKPSQEVTTTITVKNASATSSKSIVLRIWDKRSDLLPELKYDEGYTFIPGDKPDMTDVLGEATMAEITTNTNWSVSGLPDGMKFDAKKREFTGAPTKASKSYIVTFTLKSGKTTVDYATVVFRTTAFPVTKLEAWFDYLGEEMEPISTNGVKLTGGKACAANTKLSLSATAPKAEKNKDSWVFAGWYAEKGADDSRLWNGTQDWRQASKYTFTSLTNDLTTLYARFVPKSKDGAVEIECEPDPYYYVKSDMAPLAVDVTSYSKPTVTVKPLPKGMKFNANTLEVTGKPTKDGEEQTAIITVKNVSGAKATKSVILKVKDLEAVTGLKDLKYNTGYTFIPGDKDLEAVIGSTLLNELGLGGWTVSGLPAGMKWDAKNNTITGAATKALTSYTVTFTSKADKNDKATVTFRTSAFPETKLEPWFDYLGQEMDEISTDGVKLTGGKACAAGTVLKLTAKAPKAVKARKDEWVFAGWYAEMDTGCALDNGKQDWRLASSYQFTSLTNELTTLYARFVPKSLDGTVVIVCADGYNFTPNVTTSVVVNVWSYSKPTVTATPLPKGMKWDANVLAFTGKPTAPGDSKTCVIKAYNATVGKSAAETRTVALHVLDQRSDNLPMLKYDEGYDFIPGDMDLEAVLGSELLNELGYGGWTVSGLPAGMKWDSKKNKITGSATKALTSYTVTFTSKTDKKDKATVTFRTTAFPETRLEPWFDYLELDPKGVSTTNGVKLTGGKACAANTKLSLSATAPKAEKNKDPWVFAGWYEEKGNSSSALRNGTQDWRTASKYTFMSLTNELTVLYARFVPKSGDAANILLACDASETYDPNTNMQPFRVDVKSDSLIKSITWSGYPKGMSFSQDKPTVLGGNVNGTPTEPGVYQTTFKVTNQSGSQSFPLTLKVKNIFNEELDALLTDGLKDSYTGFIPGVSPEDDLTFLNLVGTDWKVSGLPGSMKLVDGCFTGAPDKPGEYTVWFKKYAGKTVVATATATFVVGSYPVLQLEELVMGGTPENLEILPISVGKLTGGGAFPANATPPVTATVTNDDYVFMGWFDSETNRIVSTTSDYRNPTKFPCPVGSNPTNVVYGIFASRSADWLLWNEINFTAIEFLVNKDASEGEDAAIINALDSGSLPTIVATGLPAGLKIDPKTLLFTGKPTKKGMYEVKLEISTASGFTYTTWIFVDVVAELMTFDDPGYPMHVVEGDEDPWWFGIDPMTFAAVFVGEYYGDEELYLGLTQLDKSGNVEFGSSTAPKNLPTGLSVSHTVTNIENELVLWDWYLKGQITQVQKVSTITCTGVDIDGNELTSKVVAYFRDSPAYWLTVVSGEGGQTKGGNLVAKPGRKTKVSAKPDEGYEFAGWYLDSEGKQPVVISGSGFNFKKAAAQEFVIPAGARDGNPVVWYALFRPVTD